MNAIRKEIDNLNMKKSKILEYNVEGKMDDDDYISMNNEINQRIKALQIETSELDNQLNSGEEFIARIKSIRKVMDKAKTDAESGIINKEFIEKYIDKIYVTPEGEDILRLEIKIFTGEITSKILEKIGNKKTSAISSVR